MTIGKTLGRFAYDSAAPQAVAAGANVLLPESTARGCISGAGNGEVRISRSGTYMVSFNATFEATAAGAVGVAMRHNGATVPGAAASATLAAAGDLASVAFASPVTVRCRESDTVSFAVDAATAVTVAACVVERVA